MGIAVERSKNAKSRARARLLVLAAQSDVFRLPTLRTSIGTFVDRLPQIRRLAASGYCAAVASGVRQLLPELDGSERDAIVRGVLRHRAFNRAVHRFHLRFPRVAAVAARCVPTTSSAQVAALLRSDRPILVAGPHIGPVFFVLTVLLGALRGRSVYVLHSSKTQFAQRNAAYLQRLGVRSVFPARRGTPAWTPSQPLASSAMHSSSRGPSSSFCGFTPRRPS